MTQYRTLLILATLFFAVLVGAATATVTYADTPQPQPYQLAMVKCSGMSVFEIVAAEQQFDSAYGWEHSLVTDWEWRASFEARANGFAHLLGCPQVFEDSGTLTRWYTWYAPVYVRFLRGEFE